MKLVSIQLWDDRDVHTEHPESSLGEFDSYKEALEHALQYLKDQPEHAEHVYRLQFEDIKSPAFEKVAEGEKVHSSKIDATTTINGEPAALEHKTCGKVTLLPLTDQQLMEEAEDFDEQFEGGVK